MITLVTLASTEFQTALKGNAVETATDVPPAVFPFTAHPGLKIPLSADARPVEFFQLFFGNDTMKLLVEETNRSVNKLIVTQMQTITFSELHL